MRGLPTRYEIGSLPNGIHLCFAEAMPDFNAKQLTLGKLD